MQDKLTDVKERIKNKISRLTESQKIIANYIVENPRKFALSSIRELETELNTSKSTVVRLAQNLGYAGYQELKSAFLQSIRSELDPIHRYKSLLSEQSSAPNYLELIAEETMNNIGDTLKLIDYGQYREAIYLLANANYVYTMGMKISSFLADIAAYLFNRISISSTPLKYSELKFTERIINMTERDVILAFAFNPYSIETIEAAEYAREKKIPVIAITDKVASEIIQYCDVYLLVTVQSSSISNSIASALVLLSSMVTQIGHDRKSKTLATIEEIYHVRKEHSR
ncbi:MAG: MurR/RpiR family transcriptional regulator [Candidatus Zhuqueibacterota bacterium]